MLIPLLLIQTVTLIAVIALWLRKPAASEADSRLTQQIIRLDEYIRTALAQIRSDIPEEAGRSRADNHAAAAGLRNEVIGNITTLGGTLKTELARFGEDNAASAERLRSDAEQRMRSLAQGFADFKAETTLRHAALQEAVNTKLVELMASNASHQEKLRATVGESLDRLTAENSGKLEAMRQTVDEKLHATLHSRLTESFGQVTDQLNKVHTGLGEMSKLSEGVDGLSRIFTNVKSRGGFAEVQLGMLLRQMLAPGQFIENATVKLGSAERVEFAVRFPTSSGERLMPIDAKFPREAWERLEAAYASNLPDPIQREGKAFESAIRTEAERICAKYINAPITTPYAIMFLPTEGLYAEVIRREALQAEIQTQCHVTIAGPTTLSAILTSFQMGFHMLALQEKGDEVWKVLEAAKTEFKTFENLMEGMEKQVVTVQNTIQKLGVRTRAINRSLREVSDSNSNQVLEFEDFSGHLPLLAANQDQE